MSWGLAFAWMLAAAVVDRWWRAGLVGTIATLLLVVSYLAVPALYAASLRKIAGLVACLLAFLVVVILTIFQVVYGHGLGLAAAASNLACLITHTVFGTAGVAVMIRWEPSVTLAPFWSEDAAEQAVRADERRPR